MLQMRTSRTYISRLYCSGDKWPSRYRDSCRADRSGATGSFECPDALKVAVAKLFGYGDVASAGNHPTLIFYVYTMGNTTHSLSYGYLSFRTYFSNYRPMASRTPTNFVYHLTKVAAVIPFSMTCFPISQYHNERRSMIIIYRYASYCF